jgi:hypothetical protein
LEYAVPVIHSAAKRQLHRFRSEADMRRIYEHALGLFAAISLPGALMAPGFWN